MRAPSWLTSLTSLTSLIWLIPAALLVVLAACQRPGPPAPAGPPSSAAAPDMHSFARPEEARVTHVALDLHADFMAKVLSGRAVLTLERAPGAAGIVLDTRELAIERVADGEGHTLDFELGPGDAVRGRPLTVSLPDGVGEIAITYRTSPGAEALQWLAPSQTAGRVAPYLYSQGQAILTRTWIPTQDSPGIRQTYSARIVVPDGLRAVMSAESLTPEGVEVSDGRAFEFRLTNPVPPYLIALAVGDIAFREISPRTGVFAEPSVLDAAAREFVDLERMVESAEALLGPYRWGRYDVLVLPPSFPFGGMENPRLTFATPTILAGDRSLVSLIAHELAHSWSGNLVTNATWRDFWLNEGVTSYVELRIMEALYGAERAAMLEVLERRALQDEIANLGGPQASDTILHVDLTGRNPDDGMTQVPYAKGATLLRLMEQTMGRDRFDPYLRSYFERHAFQSITTAVFLEDVRAHLIGGDAALADRLRLEDWLYQPGLPANAPVIGSPALALVEAQALQFVDGAPAASLATAEWSTQEWQHFLGALPPGLSPAQLRDLDGAFDLTGRGNSEVLFAWLRIAIRRHYAPALPALERFLTTQGRRKFLRPLYEDLMATDWGPAEARRLYAQARSLYHAVATTTLDGIVN
jgi:aminopeptidase N